MANLDAHKRIDEQAAQNHLLLALAEFNPLPRTHNELVEKMREYFDGQKVEVFGRIINRMGEEGFRDFIADTVIESGKYYRDPEDHQVKPVS